MPLVIIFSGSFCRAEEVARRVAERLDCPPIGAEVLQDASQESGLSVDKLIRALTGTPSMFNNLTHEREKGLIYVRAALARWLHTDHRVYHGLAAHLVPKEITHALRVCLIADRDFRVAQAGQEGLSADEARKRISKEDQELSQLTHHLLHHSPWDASLYDLRIAMHSTPVDQAVDTIIDSARREAVRPTEQSLQKAIDFIFATRINVLLVQKGHYYCDVTARGSRVTVIINKNVIRLEPLAGELKAIVGAMDGVEEVETKVGPEFNQPDIVRSYDFEIPSRVLLVDDEQDFVSAISERLDLRNIKSDVVYNGEEALQYLEDRQQAPVVMVLDLRMPGIDGIEVLRRVKRHHADVEVIILTGHGGEEDRRIAMELGAFAYLHKPVDVELLARTMKEATMKAREDETSDARQRDTAKKRKESSD
ncbi:MAG: response regulator [Gammaproteobacteria bacterium]|jgi:CheY-like chemotaxis protein|nr:response regulator [Gammaproteobacteria bacterium]